MPGTSSGNLVSSKQLNLSGFGNTVTSTESLAIICTEFQEKFVHSIYERQDNEMHSLFEEWLYLRKGR
jgi:hypothetical protein